jgi:hypothetical protein
MQRSQQHYKPTIHMPSLIPKLQLSPRKKRLFFLYLTNLIIGALLSAPLVRQPAFAERTWQRCAFNSRLEDCDVAGSSSSFTITYRSDGKQIQVEKVGSSYECGDGSSHECGKMLITEPKERRATWATYRQTPNAIIMRSSRGNTYNIPY